MQIVFRDKNVPPDRAITDELRAWAESSSDLLSEFKNVLGLHEGKIDVRELSDWVEKVRALTAAKDLNEIGDQRIGFVLAHAPQDADEPFWPPSAVCQVIEATASEETERGFAIECFNKRGAYRKGINKGGEQERELAMRYKVWADAALKYPRTSAVLMCISKDWIRNAERAEVEAERVS